MPRKASHPDPVVAPVHVQAANCVTQRMRKLLFFRKCGYCVFWVSCRIKGIGNRRFSTRPSTGGRGSSITVSCERAASTISGSHLWVSCPVGQAVSLSCGRLESAAGLWWSWCSCRRRTPLAMGHCELCSEPRYQSSSHECSGQGGGLHSSLMFTVAGASMAANSTSNSPYSKVGV